VGGTGASRARALARAAERASTQPELDADLGPIPFLAHAPASAVRGPGQDEYDALAELFLGDDRAVASEPPEPEDLAGLIGPIARSPVARGPDAIGIEPTDADEILTTARSSVTRSSGSRDDGAAARAMPNIEGVVLGHLPVLGSIWLTQLARHRARSLARPIGVVRVSAQDVMIDLVVPAPTGRVIAAQSLADAISQASALGVRDWLVRGTETDEAGLLSLAASGEVAALTILTGADDAAIVSAYRTLKALVRASGRDDAPVRVAVMGASPTRAHEARMKLADVCRQFLARPLEVEACGQQISGGGSTLTLFRGPRPADVGAMIASLRSDAPPTLREPIAAPRALADATLSMPSIEELLPALISPAPAASDALVLAQMPEALPTGLMPAAGVCATPRAAELEWDAEFRPTRPVAPTSRTERAPECGPIAEPTATALPTAHVVTVPAPAVPAPTVPAPSGAAARPASPSGQVTAEVPALNGASRLGLSPLKARCPYAKGVELAIDAARTLHVISSDGSEQGVQELASAAAWAQTNAELLADAYGVDATAPITRHVLTRRPGTMRGLIDSDLRLHALARADADGWACVPLNG
jgi:hypothetical protein